MLAEVVPPAGFRRLLLRRPLSRACRTQAAAAVVMLVLGDVDEEGREKLVSDLSIYCQLQILSLSGCLAVAATS